MSDLTDFLLARIAEDEAVAQESAADRARLDAALDMKTLDGPDLSFYADADPLPHVSVGADRVLAECEAKRKVVTDRLFRESQRPDVLSIFGLRILGTLALPYADHPDYREEWKP